MAADIVVESEREHRSSGRKRFASHYLEMVVVMFAAMAVLGGLVAGILALLGKSSVLDHSGIRALIMTADMTIGMTIWMRFRHHGWPATLEMAAAMVLPFVLLIGPYKAGLIGGDAFLIWMHVLMLPFMFVVMLRRYDEYASNRGMHASAHA